LRAAWSEDYAWENIATEYSKLSLTFPKDKLPALSGVAAKIAQHQRDRLGRYVAGCWEGTLAADLGWSLGFFDGVARPSAWRAPTWSWLSVDAPIWQLHPAYLKLGFGSITATIVDVDCALVGQDEFGELLSVRIRVAAWLEEAILFYESTVRRPEKPKWFYYVQTGHSTERELSVHPDYDIHTPGRHHLPSGSRVYLMELVRGSRVDEGFSLLLRCIHQDKQIYERVGAVEYTTREQPGLSENGKTTITLV